MFQILVLLLKLGIFSLSAYDLWNQADITITVVNATFDIVDYS